MSRLSAFTRGMLSIFDFEFDISGQSKPPEICDPVEVPRLGLPSLDIATLEIPPLGIPSVDALLRLRRIPKTIEEAWAMDAAAIASDWRKVVRLDDQKTV